MTTTAFSIILIVFLGALWVRWMFGQAQAKKRKARQGTIQLQKRLLKNAEVLLAQREGLSYSRTLEILLHQRCLNCLQTLQILKSPPQGASSMIEQIEITLGELSSIQPESVYIDEAVSDRNEHLKAQLQLCYRLGRFLHFEFQQPLNDRVKIQQEKQRLNWFGLIAQVTRSIRLAERSSLKNEAGSARQHYEQALLRLDRYRGTQVTNWATAQREAIKAQLVTIKDQMSLAELPEHEEAIMPDVHGLDRMFGEKQRHLL
jgi:hypothetical protein